MNHAEIELISSPNGIDCIGNGQQDIECQCDECDFFLDCFPEDQEKVLEPHIDNPDVVYASERNADYAAE